MHENNTKQCKPLKATSWWFAGNFSTRITIGMDFERKEACCCKSIHGNWLGACDNVKSFLFDKWHYFINYICPYDN